MRNKTTETRVALYAEVMSSRFVEALMIFQGVSLQLLLKVDFTSFRHKKEIGDVCTQAIWHICEDYVFPFTSIIIDIFAFTLGYLSGDYFPVPFLQREIKIDKLWEYRVISTELTGHERNILKCRIKWVKMIFFFIERNKGDLLKS